MENKIYAFYGKGIDSIKQILTDYMCVREFSYMRDVSDPPLSESDYILYRLGKRYVGGFIEELSVGCDNGEYEPVVFDDFLLKVDEGIDITPYFTDLLSLGVPVFYFAEQDRSIERICESGLPLEFCQKCESYDHKK